MKIFQAIDKHIERKTRDRHRVKTTGTIPVRYSGGHSPQLPVMPPAPGGLQWTKRYYIEQRSHHQADNTAIIANSLAYDHQETSVTGTFDGSTTWTDDGTPGWTNDEWINHYLRTGSPGNYVYQLITNNDSGTLTIELSNQSPPEDGSYSIIPFKPSMFVGAWLVPDINSLNRRYAVIGCSSYVISVDINIFLISGTITTGDASSPYNTFRDSGFIGVPDDTFNDYTLEFLTGVNAGEAKGIIDFDSATGEFTTQNFTNAISIGDTFKIRNDMVWCSIGDTFRLEGYVTPVNSDFEGQDPGDVFSDLISSADGSLVDAGFEDYTNAHYSIELLPAGQISTELQIVCVDSIKITVTQEGGETMTLHDSEFRPNQVTSVPLILEGGVWTRLDVYYYAENGVAGFQINEDFTRYLAGWRIPVGDAPDISVTAGEKGILLEWDVEHRHETQLQYSTDAGSTWVDMARILPGQGKFLHDSLTGQVKLSDNTTYHYRARWLAKDGCRSSWSTTRNTTTQSGLLNTVVTGTLPNPGASGWADLYTHGITNGKQRIASATICHDKADTYRYGEEMRVAAETQGGLMLRWNDTKFQVYFDHASSNLFSKRYILHITYATYDIY